MRRVEAAESLLDVRLQLQLLVPVALLACKEDLWGRRRRDGKQASKLESRFFVYFLFPISYNAAPRSLTRDVDGLEVVPAEVVRAQAQKVHHPRQRRLLVLLVF